MLQTEELNTRPTVALAPLLLMLLVFREVAL